MATRNRSKADLEAMAGFRHRLRRFLRFIKELSHRNWVTPLQYRLLLQVKRIPGHKSVTVPDLSERLQIKHPSVVALISRCEAAGLVGLSASRSDQRRVEVRLAPSGERCLERLGRLHGDELPWMRGGVPGFGDGA